MNPQSSGTELAADGLLRLQLPNIVLAGPPGAGKSAVGRRLAEQLGREFVDTDAVVERVGGKPIARIFAEDGEAAFRRLESRACRQVAEPAGLVVACGGGALLDEGSRALLQAGGSLVCLTGEPRALLARLPRNGSRPLLAGDDPAGSLQVLLALRRQIYDSIPVQIDTTALTIEQVAGRIAEHPLAGRTVHLAARQPQPGYQVVLGEGLLPDLAAWMEHAGLHPPYLLVSDTNVAPLHGQAARQALECSLVSVPAGERHKSPTALLHLYNAFADAGVDRSSTVIALGGGIVMDLAGFAAATYLRGIRWAAVPTTLLAMVDAGLGGKVGVNLQAGKNLVGAFHPPGLVCADLTTLSTLPRSEVQAALAEIIKAALVGDADLFGRMETGPRWVTRDWIQRAMLVKLQIVDQDPYERGRRAALNLGHTFAHALEAVGGYRLPHGQAVAVGLLGAARLAHALQLCDADLPDRVHRLLHRFELPAAFTGLEADEVLRAMRQDKKARAGRVRFVLPVRPGLVELGIEAPEGQVRDILDGLRAAR